MLLNLPMAHVVGALVHSVAALVLQSGVLKQSRWQQPIPKKQNELFSQKVWTAIKLLHRNNAHENKSLNLLLHLTQAKQSSLYGRLRISRKPLGNRSESTLKSLENLLEISRKSLVNHSRISWKSCGNLLKSSLKSRGSDLKSLWNLLRISWKSYENVLKSSRKSLGSDQKSLWNLLKISWKSHEDFLKM